MKDVILSEDELISSLFQYISKNKIIPQFFAEIKANPHQAPHKSILLALQRAVKRGDVNAQVFEFKNCHLYLLYLIKEKQISFSQGMTLYAALMGRMQFTNQQGLKPEDNKLKSIRSFQFKTLVENKKLTDFGIFYLHQICERFKKINLNVDYQHLVDEILKLPKTEQCVMRVPFNSDNSHDTDALLNILVSNVPFFCKQETDKFHEYLCSVPSVSLINLFLKQVSPNPVQMKFIFGTVNEETLTKLHQLNQHPVNLYATDVKSNLITADKYTPGPFLVWLHDVAHAFWGSMLSFEDRIFLQEEVMRQLKIMESEALRVNDVEVTCKLFNMMRYLQDYNLTPIDNFKDPSTRMKKLMLYSFNPNLKSWDGSDNIFMLRGITAPLGGIEDRLFFLFCAVSRMVTDQKKQKFWQDFLWENIRAAIEMSHPHFGKRYIHAIAQLVSLNFIAGTLKQKCSFFKTGPAKINQPERWLTLLENGESSQSLWKLAVEKYKNDLLTLLREYKLKFFEPYIPLSENERKRLINIIKSQLETTPSPITNELEFRNNRCVS